MALSENNKQATVKLLPTINREIDIKSSIGSDFVSLRNGMEVRLKGKWHSCGEKG